MLKTTQKAAEKSGGYKFGDENYDCFDCAVSEFANGMIIKSFSMKMENRSSKEQAEYLAELVKYPGYFC
jgi:enolase